MNGNGQVQQFALGPITVALRTDIKALRQDYGTLYAPYACDAGMAPLIKIDALRGPWVPWRRRRCRIHVNQRLQFEPDRPNELLPFVEWAINWEIPNVLNDHVVLHAASIQVEGCGIILAGESGAGKSTLAAGLLARGGKYLCDEFALIQTERRELSPYPRAICVKQPSFPVVESLGLSLVGRPVYSKGFKGLVRFIDPLSVRSDSIGQRCRPELILFPKYVAGAEPALHEIPRAEAAMELHRVCFSLFRGGRNAVAVIADVVRAARCYRLTSGEIHQTCRMIEGLASGREWSLARSA